MSAKELLGHAQGTFGVTKKELGTTRGRPEKNLGKSNHKDTQKRHSCEHDKHLDK